MRPHDIASQRREGATGSRSDLPAPAGVALQGGR